MVDLGFVCDFAEDQLDLCHPGGRLYLQEVVLVAVCNRYSVDQFLRVLDRIKEVNPDLLEELLEALRNETPLPRVSNPSDALQRLGVFFA